MKCIIFRGIIILYLHVSWSSKGHLKAHVSGDYKAIGHVAHVHVVHHNHSSTVERLNFFYWISGRKLFDGINVRYIATRKSHLHKGHV
uniref:Putative secreted protein n=1 Tax=Anopheles darlingi TaxID=43151 RepID=A0A2M4DCJ8_ANODA